MVGQQAIELQQGAGSGFWGVRRRVVADRGMEPVAISHGGRMMLAIINGLCVSTVGGWLEWPFWHGFVVSLIIGIAIVTIIPEVE